MNSKGITSSVSSLFLILMLLALANVISSNLSVNDDIAEELIEIDRVRQMHENIESNLSELMENSLDVNVLENESSFSVTEVLSQDNAYYKYDNYVQGLNTYKSFIASKSNASLDIFFDSNNERFSSFSILPFDINYSHPELASSETNSKIQIKADSINFSAISFTADLSSQTYESISVSPNPLPNCSGCSNPIDINITVIDPDTSSNVQNYTNIDSDENFSITISASELSGSDLVIEKSGNSFTVTCNDSNSIKMTSSIHFDSNSSPEFAFYSGLFTVSSEKGEKT